MAVPETTMDEDDLPQLGEDNVWFSRKSGNVGPEFETARTSYFPHQEFRFGVLGANERHALTSFAARKGIHVSQQFIFDFRGW